jgi:hypothetical protein
MLKAKAEIILLTLNLKKMQTQKMSLANIQGKLSRVEMKKIAGGAPKCCIPNSCVPGVIYSCDPLSPYFCSQQKVCIPI